MFLSGTATDEVQGQAMEEKNSKIQSIIEYKEKLKDFRNRRAMVAAAVVILILAAALGIAGFIRYRTFSS